MMTKEMILELMNSCKDILVNEYSDDYIDVTIDDFAGFDDEWNEVYNDINEEQIDSILETLDKECIRKVDDLYVHYYLDGFMVCVGWSSFDI